ncbi:MAG TPA: hypothetical protein VFE37_17270 [Chloroflexota bacterium]|nr:hypothetical protein [Chloroflexota bacterium]
MSEPTPRGPTPPDALEALLRAAAADMDYPPTPPLAGAVRARLEREAAAPPRRRWWRGDALTPGPSPRGRGESDHLSPRGRGGSGHLSPRGRGESGHLSPWGRGGAGRLSPWRRGGSGAIFPRERARGEGGSRWAAPGLAALALAVLAVVWLPRNGAPLAGGRAAGEVAQRPVAASTTAPAAAAPVAGPAGPGQAAARGAVSPPAAAANQAAPAAAAQGTARGAASDSAGAAPAAAPSELAPLAPPASGGDQAPGAPAVGPGWEPAGSLAEAEARAGFQALVPTALGEPDAVYARTTGGGAIELRYGPRPAGSPSLAWAVLSEALNDGGRNMPDRAEPVSWAGGVGWWFSNEASPGGFLLFTEGGLRLRLDVPLSRDEAVAIAASVAPAAE